MGIARARQKGTRSGRTFGRSKLSAEREAAVRASLAAGTGIRKTARLVGTGNATVARIAAPSIREGESHRSRCSMRSCFLCRRPMKRCS